jgi:hypothetical protein
MTEQSSATTEQQIGFTTPDKQTFTDHLMFEGQKDGAGVHKSLGRINLKTGEVVTPPWKNRSSEEKKQTAHKASSTKAVDARKSRGGGSSDGGSGEASSGSDGGGGGGGLKPQTTNLAEAQQIRMVSRVFTMDYSPILRAAQDAAVNFFNWRPDMPLQNFIDTCLYLFFEEKGITLCGYIVSEALLKKEGKNNGG